MILLYAVRRPGFVRRRKTRCAHRRARARSTADYAAVVNRSALGGTATGSHTHTHTPTHTCTIQRISYTLYTTCRVLAMYNNIYNNNNIIYFVLPCSRRQIMIIYNIILLWKDIILCTLRPRSLNGKRINLWPDEILKRVPCTRRVCRIMLYYNIMCKYYVYIFIPTPYTDRPPNGITIVFPIFYFPYITRHIISLVPHPFYIYTIINIYVHVPAFMCTHARYIVIYIFIVCVYYYYLYSASVLIVL